MIQDAHIEDLEIIDKEALTRCLQEAALWGVGVRPLHRLNLTLSLLKWLSMQDEWRWTFDPPAEIIRVHRRDELSGKAKG
jgi:hypothetical protein